MSKIDLDFGFWVRMILRAVVLLWFYKLGQVAALSDRINSGASNLQSSEEGWFFWIKVGEPGIHGVNGGIGFFFWSGLLVAAMVALIVEFWMKQKYEKLNYEE